MLISNDEHPKNVNGNFWIIRDCINLWSPSAELPSISKNTILTTDLVVNFVFFLPWTGLSKRNGTKFREFSQNFPKYRILWCRWSFKMSIFWFFWNARHWKIRHRCLNMSATCYSSRNMAFDKKCIGLSLCTKSGKYMHPYVNKNNFWRDKTCKEALQNPGRPWALA